MGKHSLKEADSRWVGLLESMTNNRPSEQTLPIPAAFFMKEESWESTKTIRTPGRHRQPSAFWRLLRWAQAWLWLLCGDRVPSSSPTRQRPRLVDLSKSRSVAQVPEFLPRRVQ